MVGVDHESGLEPEPAPCCRLLVELKITITPVHFSLPYFLQLLKVSESSLRYIDLHLVGEDQAWIPEAVTTKVVAPPHQLDLRHFVLRAPQLSAALCSNLERAGESMSVQLRIRPKKTDGAMD